MKKLIRILSITTLTAIAAIALIAPLLAGDSCCSGGTPGSAQSVSGTQSSMAKPADHAQKYVCPMHPDVVYDKPGKCPKCGMTLVPAKDGAKSSM